MNNSAQAAMVWAQCPPDPEGIQGKPGKQDIDQDHDNNEYLVGFQGCDRTEYGKNKIADKGNAQLLTVRGSGQHLPQSAHFDEPNRGRRPSQKRP